MAQNESILIATGDGEKSAQIGRLFQEARLLNPILLADDPEKARSLLLDQSETPVSLLLLELKEKWSWEFLKWLDAAREKCRVIGLIAENQAALIDKAYEAGVATCLKMPFQFSEFLEKSRLLKLQYYIIASQPVP